jgi:bis(5'-nucleosyl)-tetraphosphatase (symmetrical)
MATYAIGDIQGCFAAFERLLERIRFDPHGDRLWLVGDLVNRGPQSLEILRWAYQHRDAVTAVLGNHDLHLLARAAGVREPKSRDTVDEVLEAPDSAELLDWLRHRPFLVTDGQYAMVHAGLLPSWTVEQAAQLARELESALQGPQYDRVIESIYSGVSADWSETLDPSRRWSALADVFTRLRICTLEGQPRYDFAGPLDQIPQGCLPWFAFPQRRSTSHKIICGHWAALGLYCEPGLFALDSGCVWGGELTALRLDDEQIIRQPCGK